MTGAAAPPARSALPSRQIAWLALGLGIALAALAAGFMAFELREVREDRLARVSLYARALDEVTAATTASTETILRSFAPVAERQRLGDDMQRLGVVFQDSLRGRAYLRSLSLLDAQGRVLASSNPENLGTVVPNLHLQGAPAAGPRLGALAAGRDLHELAPQATAQARVNALPMVLPLARTDGAWQLVALINPDHLATQYERMLDGSAAQALLLGLDGRLIAATSGVQQAAGTDLGHLPLFGRLLPAREFGAAIGAGTQGGKVLSAYWATRQWPLVVLVEQPYATVTSAVSEAAGWAAAFLLLAWAGLVGGALFARRRLRRDEQLSHDLQAAHEATKASESRKLAILQSSLDAIVTIDIHGRIVEFNAAAERMFGRSADAVLQQPMHELIVPPALRAAHQAGMARYLATGEGPVLNRRIEIEAQRADGSTFPVELTIAPVRTESGELFTATLRDITERRRVEQALRDSEARAHATFEQAAVGVLQQAPDRRFLRVNQTLCTLLGYTREEFLALDADTLVHPDDVADGVAGMHRLFAGEISSFAQDKRYRRKDGSTVWVRLTASIARDGQGQALYMIGIVEDIGARRRAEHELAAARTRELLIGARIQQSLLVTPPPPDQDGVQISSHNQASQGIDGDFVEVVRVGRHCVDIVLGDVMGKGLAAALMGAGTKLQFSRSIAELVTAATGPGRPPRPADIVAAVHRAMTPALQALEAFVTLCYVRIDTLRDRVTWVGCGHEETLLVRHDGSRLSLANQHPPLGVLDEAEYHEDELPMRPGDALFLCSDGITDALTQDGQRIGRERVADAVAQCLQLHPTAAAALHRVRALLLADDVQFQDDVTMLVARRDASPDAGTREELPVTLQALRSVRHFVQAATRQAALADTSAALLEVAAVEAFTNIVRHGRGRLRGAPVELLAHHPPDALVLDLVYLGEPFEAPQDLPETDFGNFPEGGFGLQIMHGACDSVLYLHEHGVNTVRMIKHH